MSKKTIAKNEFEIKEVLDNLSDEVKIERVSKLYPVDDILEVLGYQDGSMDDEDIQLIEDSGEAEDVIYKMAINNGNFEQAIAMDKYLPI
jgi:hypothetical protein